MGAADVLHRDVQVAGFLTGVVLLVAGVGNYYAIVAFSLTGRGLTPAGAMGVIVLEGLAVFDGAVNHGVAAAVKLTLTMQVDCAPFVGDPIVTTGGWLAGTPVASTVFLMSSLPFPYTLLGLAPVEMPPQFWVDDTSFTAFCSSSVSVAPMLLA